ncbi:MAG: PHP domain-containing protein [Bifidobacteriaceae bacterium]|jgi:predicted metal-dependent phosphoesterase TrpH|nr:PHP domain-containing protein [Bifidobacteriaceae bacterium]
MGLGRTGRPHGPLIDLHTHSVVSDGTDTPAQVVAKAAVTGLTVVGLTDHDSAAGWSEAADAARRHGITLIRGTELSCRTRGITVHLLSYLHEPTYGPLVAEQRRVREAREERARAMVARLAADFPITWEAVVEHTGEEATVGRPHIADTLVALGVVPDRSAAFAKLLHPRSPYYVRHYAPEAANMVALVREAGGVPVLAHPAAVGRQRIIDDDAIGKMAEAGLAALEVYHRDNPPAQRVRLLRLAKRFDLLVTGSSDYHGAGKPNRLGENLTNPAVYQALVAQGELHPV